MENTALYESYVFCEETNFLALSKYIVFTFYSKKHVF